MKRFTPILLAAALVCVFAHSCGTSYKLTAADTSIQTSYAAMEDVRMVIFTDDHSRTRKNADTIFDQWAEENHLKSNITGKRLMSIAQKQEGCILTYNFRMIAGNQQRIVIVVPDYVKAYRKKHKQYDKTVVNGKEYQFNH